MLFKAAVLEAIAAGTVTVAFRVWRRPTVRAGGTLTTPVGILAIHAVDVVGLDEIEDGDARKAGFDGVADLVATLPASLPAGASLYRIAFSRAGDDPRRALAADDGLSDAAMADIRARLDRLDRGNPWTAATADIRARLDRLDRGNPWTAATLAAIAADPGRRAADIATSLGREGAPFKRDVRKLKALGLTESLEVGYRLTPRGHAVVAVLAHRGSRN